MAKIQINYCGDIIWIKEEELPRYQEKKEKLIALAMANGDSREEAEYFFYLKILKERK